MGVMLGRRRRTLMLLIVGVIAIGMGAYFAVRLSTTRTTASLTAKDAAAALRSAGVRPIAVQRVAGATVVAQPGWKEARGWLDPLYVVLLPSASQARATYDRGYSAKAVARQAAEAVMRPQLYRGVFPKGWPKGVTTVRVCNAIIVANNPDAATVRAVALDRAIRALSAKCG